MSNQMHKRLTDDQVRTVLDLYDRKAITLEQALQQLGCKRSRFYQILKKYRKDPKGFTIAYARHYPQRRLSEDEDWVIRDELEMDRKLIADKNTPIRGYNYAAARDEVVKRLGYKISTQTVRNRAKKWGYWIPRVRKERNVYREVLTKAAGILLQHDSSHHKWSPYVDKKWTLITTLKDYSRYLLYGDLVEIETTWAHIQAVESVVLNYGAGLTYYVDSHSIFRYVCHKDSFWYNQVKGTDEVLTQWKKVVEKCGMQVWYALSAEAKGKVERPYRWLQDRLVRRCAREKVRDISKARMVLNQELHRYNEEKVHSTTEEIPAIRLKRAIKEGNSCFKPLKISPMYKSTKDIFCLHEYRKVDGYNKISWNNNKILIPVPLPQGTEIELHVVPYENSTEVRIWYDERIIKVVHYKNTTLIN